MTDPINPDCRDGKHAACNEDAWNVELDMPDYCACSCHGGTRTISDNQLRAERARKEPS